MPHSALPDFKDVFNNGKDRSDKATMQLIYAIEIDPEQYVAQASTSECCHQQNVPIAAAQKPFGLWVTIAEI